MKGTYGVEEVAKILALHKETVRRFIREGKIKGIWFKTHWRVTENEIKRILNVHGNQHQGTGERA